MSSEGYDKFDQEARSILLRHYSSLSQHWGIVFVTALAGFVGLFQVSGVLFPETEEFVRILCSIAMFPVCYICVKLFWYGRLSSKVLSTPISVRGELRYNYLTRLEHGIVEAIGSTGRGAFLNRLRKWHFLLPVSGVIVLLTYFLLVLQSILPSNVADMTKEVYDAAFSLFVSGAILFALLYHVSVFAREDQVQYAKAYDDNLWVASMLLSKNHCQET
jgi:hypothetical protein